jgi:hypothetical protein
MVPRIGIYITITGLSVALINLALGALGVTISHLLAYFLLAAAGILLLGGGVFVFWDWLKHLVGAYTFQVSFRKKTEHAQVAEHSQTAIPVVLTSQLQNPKDDAICHLVISGRDYFTLNILRGTAGWPVEYPIRLLNTRPIPVELIGFTVNIYWNDKPVETVIWNKPDNYTSNGVSMPQPVIIQGDQPLLFNVLVLLAKIKAPLPEASPSWGTTGELRFRGDKENIERKLFDFKNDRYSLSSQDWEDLRKYVYP